jgi:2-iminobutanoate/2-iminopropanoate deaminase
MRIAAFPPIVSIAAASIAALLSSCIVVADNSTGPVRGRWDYNLEGRSDSLPFSHAVLVDNTLYIAGTLGLDPETGQAPESVEIEARAMLDSFRAKLALAGLGMDNLVSVQIFCTDLDLYTQFNAIYAEYFGDQFPVRAFIGSGPLLRGARFEMNGIAVVPAS